MADRFAASLKPGSLHFKRVLTPRSLRGRLLAIWGAGLITAQASLTIGLASENQTQAPTLLSGRFRPPISTEVAALDGRTAPRLGSEKPSLAVKTIEVGEHPAQNFPINYVYQDSDNRRATESPNAIGAAVGGHLVLFLILGFLGWLAIRQVVKPLADFTAAANALQPEQLGPRLSETGPSEVVAAAKAFNRMRSRITQHLEERVHLLSALSHDMQTPITRMRLRTELAAEFPEREKLLQDLAETERLVQEGIAYAKNVHVKAEEFNTIDLRSFIESVASDYQDTGRLVSIVSLTNGTIVTKSRAFRRILSNFIDNALKYAGAAEITTSRRPSGETVIAVMDRGPGIAEDLLEAVKKPFVRLPQVNQKEVAGAGLGLAIAQQLATDIAASINLRSRPEGGLVAEIIVS